MAHRFLLCAALVLTTGCATGKLQQRTDELEKSLSAIQRNQALSAARLDEINRLSHTVFLLQDRVEQMSLDMADLRAQNEALARKPVYPAPAAHAAPAKNVAVIATPPETGADAAGLYRDAYELLKVGDYATSGPKFQSLIDRYPDHELSDNAQYWLGEIDYARRDYRAALTSFGHVITRYPNGNKVPDALLKMAFCYIELGERDRARESLERIVRDFSWSEPARKARERLQTLGS